MSNDRRPSRPGNAGGFSRSNLAVGVRVLSSGYVLKRLIGRGGTSEVWLAWDRQRELDVALKFLPHSLLQDKNVIEHLSSEIERCKQLKHESIARVFDFVHDYESVAISMEHVDGWSLAALKVDRQNRRYRLPELFPYIRQLCAALDYAHHDICLVHRDLKPANLLVNGRDQLKVTDFGIGQTVRTALAQQGHLIYGALSYLSPQQLKGAQASVLDDVYALGATIYDLLTGTPPFYKGEILAQVHETVPQRINERLVELGIEDSIPGWWEDGIAASLSKEPAARPQSAQELLQRLEFPPAEKVPIPANGAAAGSEKLAVSSPVVAASVEPVTTEVPARELAEDRGEAAKIESGEPPEGVAAAIAEVANLEKPVATGASDAGMSESADIEQEAGAVAAAENKATKGSESLLLMWRRLPTRTQYIAATSAGLVLVTALLLIVASLQHGRGKQPTSVPGAVDKTFAAGAGADGEIRTVAIQANGSVLVGGKFSTFDGAAVKGAARLDSQGRAETNFAPLISGAVHAIALQSDGKILVGGDFTRVGDQTRRRIGRLNADGALDSSFDPRGAINREVRTIAVQRDSKIIAGGSFDGSSGHKHNRITRFNPDGGRDGTFTPGAGANAVVLSVVIQPDEKIIVAGDFSRFDNNPCGRIVRLNPDGTVDPSFRAGAGATASILSVCLQQDGKILVAGNFSSFAQTSRNRIARLHADGTLDSSFDPAGGPNSSIRTVAIQPGGNILVGGTFTEFQDVARGCIARLRSDGRIDPTFDPGEGTKGGGVWRLEPYLNDRVIIVGGFTNFHGTARGRIAGLHAGTAQLAK
jgi:uncharacterized delta-60 repeat protein